jgi:hypothetical protein
MSTLIQLSTKQNPIVLTTDGTPVAGTIVETDCAIIQVNQGQLDNRDMFSVIAKQLIVNGIVGQSLYRLYYNNIPTFAGGSLIAQSASLDTINNSSSFSRYFTISSGNIIGADNIQLLNDDFNQTTDTTTYIDLGNTMYFIFTIENTDPSIIADVPKLVLEIYK